MALPYILQYLKYVFPDGLFDLVVRVPIIYLSTYYVNELVH